MARPAWASHDRTQKPQPGAGVLARGGGIAQPCQGRRQTISSALQPQQVHEQKHGERGRHDPRLVGVERGAAARGHGGEQNERAEQDQRGIAGEQQQRCRDAERVPGPAPPLPDRPPVMQQHDCPQCHGENGRAEIRRRHREQRNADHEQHRHGGVRRADDGAAQRKHAPIGRDHANLRQRIDAEQAGETERDLGQPIGQRRPDVAAELEFVTDGEELRQVARGRRIKHHRHDDPNDRLCQRRRPEQQVRARAQRLNVKRNVEYIRPAERRRRAESSRYEVALWTGLLGRIRPALSERQYAGSRPSSRIASASINYRSASATGENERR